MEGFRYGNALFASNTNLGGYSDTDKNRIRANGGLIYEFKYVKGLKAKMSISMILIIKTTSILINKENSIHTI